MTSDGTTRRSFEQLSQAQLEIYATELREHFHQVRQLHQELEEEKQRMERSLQELAALNRLFQEHLGQRQALDEAYSQVVDGLRRLTREAATLGERARRSPSETGEISS